jgi:hypothetical protein
VWVLVPAGSESGGPGRRSLPDQRQDGILPRFPSATEMSRIVSDFFGFMAQTPVTHYSLFSWWVRMFRREENTVPVSVTVDTKSKTTEYDVGASFSRRWTWRSRNA